MSPEQIAEIAYRRGWQDGIHAYLAPYPGDWWERAKKLVMQAVAAESKK